MYEVPGGPQQQQQHDRSFLVVRTKMAAAWQTVYTKLMTGKGVINRCRMYLVCCAVNAPKLRTFGAIFVRKRDEVHLSARYFLIVLADPYSVCSVGGGLGRPRVVSRRNLLPVSVFAK